MAESSRTTRAKARFKRAQKRDLEDGLEFLQDAYDVYAGMPADELQSGFMNALGSVLTMARKAIELVPEVPAAEGAPEPERPSAVKVAGVSSVPGEGVEVVDDGVPDVRALVPKREAARG